MCEYLELVIVTACVATTLFIFALIGVWQRDNKIKDLQGALGTALSDWAAEVDEKAWGHRDGNA